jgi:hypothetical protein
MQYRVIATPTYFASYGRYKGPMALLQPRYLIFLHPCFALEAYIYVAC